MAHYVGTRRTMLRSLASPWWLLSGVAAANAVAIYKPIGAASLAESYINLATPGTYNAAPGTAPTWAAATGWTFAAASSQYLTTGITPESTWTMLVRFSGAPSSGDCVLAGSRKSNATKSRFFLASTLDAADVNKVAYGNGDQSLVSPRLTSGVIAIAGAQGYRNGAADGTAIGAPDDTYAAIFIGARNTAGTASLFASASIQAIAIYNTTLTAAQVLAVSSAMAGL